VSTQKPVKLGKLLKIMTLPSGQWCDREYLILHACFQILSDFFEKELDTCTHVHTDIGWRKRLREAQRIKDPMERRSTIDCIRGNAAVYGELRKLLKWWKNYDRLRNEAMAKTLKLKRFSRGKHPLEKFEEQEQKNLLRLIALRRYLWT